MEIAHRSDRTMAPDHFGTFTPGEVADAHATTGVLLALSRDMREEVDTIVETADPTSGKADIRERQDLGWLYTCAFRQPRPLQ